MKLIEYMYRITLTHHQHFYAIFFSEQNSLKLQIRKWFYNQFQHEEGCRGGEEEEIGDGE